MSDQWHISRDGKSREGPFTTQQVKTMLQVGQLRAHMLCWQEGMAGWTPLSGVPVFVAAPPPLPMKSLVDPVRHTPPPPMPPMPSVQPTAAPVQAVVPAVAAPVVQASGASAAVSGMQYAGFWLRFVAAIIDGVIAGTMAAIVRWGVGFVFVQIILASDGKISVEEANPFFVVCSLLASTLVSWLYFATLESSRRQATLGKLAMGLRVTDGDGARLRFSRATGRYFAKILSALILLIGYLMAAWTPRKQGLHDIMADTLVLRGAVPLR